MLDKRLIRFDGGGGATADIPVAEARGARPGPVLTLLAGVHGCEYAPMAALRTFMRGLDPDRLRGTVRAVLMANPAAFRERTPFVTPVDGKNLNRCFPGDAGGSYSDRLADFLFRRFVLGSDALIDLHAGDQAEALEPYTLYDESAVADRAAQLATGYGLPLVIRQPAAGAAVAGSTSAAAAQAGIPAIIAEAGGCGLVTPEAVELHLTGLRRTADHLGITDTGTAWPDPPGLRHLTRFDWLRTGVEGWWQPEIAPGAEVSRGALLGRVTDPFGEELEAVHADESGVVAFLTTSPAVTEGGLLLAIAGAPCP
ncbi:succinylglutamate desuccinylase/aspartoacylase family protein [Kitasatospora kazusensis]|uniref:Succinylglutamate desuccinylase/aspartoacylase family protein n=1 Tax=Kitasatospora kazusensis TaxID=407974 RepID=A0ABP5L123_9ACTN